MPSVAWRGGVCSSSPRETRRTRLEMLEAVSRDGMALRNASPLMRGDRRVVLDAVRQWGQALQFASMVLRQDRQIVLEAVKSDGWALQYAAEALRADIEVVTEAVKSFGEALYHASADLKKDRKLVLEAVRSHGGALQYASHGLRSDKDVVLQAVRADPLQLCYASKDLRADSEVVAEAVKLDGWALLHASQELWSDPNLATQAVTFDGSLMHYIPQELRSNTDVVRAAVCQSGEALQYATSELRNDKDIVMEAVRQRGSSLRFASEQLRADAEVISTAASQDQDAADAWRLGAQPADEVAVHEWRLPSRAQSVDDDSQDEPVGMANVTPDEAVKHVLFGDIDDLSFTELRERLTTLNIPFAGTAEQMRARLHREANRKRSATDVAESKPNRRNWRHVLKLRTKQEAGQRAKKRHVVIRRPAAIGPVRAIPSKVNGKRMNAALELGGEHGQFRRIKFVQDNPKRGGAWKRYEMYKSARTLAEFYACGGSTTEMRQNLASGNVKLM
eukprot:TRINITY_DN22148_c0_g1_i2.p1 TRINITY_DN22148_c0_g1~~TRINITY_DN22148_c0_g1_i2.p1  ORF type:complete len:519 (+),score=98.01 TRINITY_DN22148_c0_g1_i2:45-1559(+)